MQLSKSIWVGIGIAISLMAAMEFLQPAHRIKEITINASIDPNYSYSVRVSYVSSRDIFFCNSYSLFGGKSSSLKELNYHPKIESGRHIVSFPINEPSPTKGCRWLPRYVSLCVKDNADPKIWGCSRLFDVAKSSTVLSGVVIDNRTSNFDKPIKISCKKDMYEQTHLWCRYVPIPEDGDNNSSFAGTDLLIFPGVKGDQFPFDREDVYWLDIGFVSTGEEAIMQSQAQDQGTSDQEVPDPGAPSEGQVQENLKEAN